ncbi:ABC transporter ATP-binding protein [Aetokthonos hydrillicola Thurmond2011]|jgi:phospholipid/cholesterol/gamma-HCH transport system ATP-binding protein|uniref:ABC transporter ATP-binding protein n=1 Tax=Aetokthonos hydrillicola Thurmond2011 TaxID=2712845 RepID=A0AAP5I3E8_9CYAN|nr:ABC transporter ATP-binding protein [Aetokthonos hydrillicola]MBO3461849.1 ABC transporter ATP-binding protein [Aetokthonos hydrillicola CCALA 1050]MBW4588881.1 ABC transporter ATP-binding protein [Aetokthonos hydrillicola CCALA 1050]MDR9894071.1 ABC transporter ATP-binding protein [Aetokthonos hydrillicola Thurmond2011]
MTEALIELKGVSKSFDSNKVLDNVDLTINRGEALGIIGPSGTGKSTILRIIAGLDAPDAGEIYLQGRRREGLIEDYGNSIGIGMVFQQAALFDSLTVEENVGFSLFQDTKLSRSRIRELVHEKLEMVGLRGTGDRYPAELSGGMRKRVSFARAIMSNPDNPEKAPEILLYDEPTAGLDPIASTVIENLIQQLHCTTGICNTYAIVTHQHSTIHRTARRIVFLYKGKVQWQGSVSEIDTTDNPLIQQFISGSVQGPIHVVG